MTHSFTWPIAALIGTAALLNSGFHACGQAFTIDPAQSTITISGVTAGAQLKEQATGSMTTRYQGSIVMNSTAGGIRFPGGSQIAAQNSGSWEPKTDATAGTEPANYGGQASLLFSTAKAALRNVMVDVISPEISVSNGQFDSRSLAFVFPTNVASTLSYIVTGLLNDSGAKQLSGYATNSITTVSTLQTEGGIQTLTMPVDATFITTLISTGDTTLRLQGKIVCTRSTEPPLRVDPLEITSQAVTLRWQAPAGQVFQVMTSPNLSDWQNASGNITSETGTYSWSEPVSTSPSARFYQIRR